MSNRKPSLQGCRVLVTRTRKQAARSCAEIERRGGIAVPMPTIKIVPPTDPKRLSKAVLHIHDYDWLILTSANAVEPLVSALKGQAIALESLSTLKTCAIGPGTARELDQYGIACSVIATEYIAEGILAALQSEDLSGKRILIPRAEQARDILPETLRERGATVDVIAAYRTVLPPEKKIKVGFDELKAGTIDLVTFTSASTVHHFVTLVGGEKAAKTLLEKPLVAAIGPITAAALTEHQLNADVVAETYTVAGMLDAVEKFLARSQ